MYQPDHFKAVEALLDHGRAHRAARSDASCLVDRERLELAGLHQRHAWSTGYRTSACCGRRAVSLTAGALPLYGTCWMSSAGALLEPLAATDARPRRRRPRRSCICRGFSLIILIRSLTLLTGNDGCTIRTVGDVTDVNDRREILQRVVRHFRVEQMDWSHAPYSAVIIV